MLFHNLFWFLLHHNQFKTQFSPKRNRTKTTRISSLKEANLVFISHATVGFIVYIQITEAIWNILVQVQGKLTLNLEHEALLPRAS